ncbi:MAG: amino acid oxidase, partial [Colwellia sp.]
DVPDEIKNKSFTLMCGPFFSVMPFPSTNHYTFTHVRYTPHYGWLDKYPEKFVNADKQFYMSKPKSNWKKMQKDATKYIPILGECKFVSSIWEIKTTLPSSENSDSRPILFKQDHGVEGFHCVMGGKIDNVYDAIEIISTKKVSGVDGTF